jgi:hypothetical protein
MTSVPAHLSACLALVGAAGGLCLLIGPFIGRGRTYTHIVRVGCWLAGTCFVLWGAALLVLQFMPLSSGTEYFLRFIEPRVGAAGFAVLLLFILSGALFRGSARAGDAQSGRSE